MHFHLFLVTLYCNLSDHTVHAYKKIWNILFWKHTSANHWWDDINRAYWVEYWSHGIEAGVSDSVSPFNFGFGCCIAEGMEPAHTWTVLWGFQDTTWKLQLLFQEIYDEKMTPRHFPYPWKDQILRVFFLIGYWIVISY